MLGTNMKNNSVVSNNKSGINNNNTNWTWIVVSFSSLVCALLSFCCGIVTPILQNELLLQMSAARINGIPGYYVNFRKLLSSSTSSSSSTYNVNNNNINNNNNNCDDDTILSNYLTDNHTVPGYHLVCVTTTTTTTTTTTNDNDSNDKSSSTSTISKVITLNFYSNGLKERTTSMTFINNVPTWDDLHFIITSVFHLPKQQKKLKKPTSDSDNNTSTNNNEKEYIQPWAIFTPDGQYIINEQGESYLSTNDMEEQNNNNKKQQNNKIISSILLNNNKIGMFTIYEGGHFIWPGISIGYTRTNVILYTIMPKDSIIHFPYKVQYVTIHTISLQPLLFSIQNQVLNHNNNNNNRPFISDNECNSIVELYATAESTGRIVTTETTTIVVPKTVTDIISLLDIDYRIASLVRIPRQNQEQLKISINKNHYYINDDDTNTNNTNIVTMDDDNHTHRIVTVFMYLTTVKDGGETIFLINPTNQQQEQQSKLSIDDYCSNDYNNNNNNNNNDDDDVSIIKIKQQHGKIIYMYHLLPNGLIDPYITRIQKISTCPVLSYSTTRNSNQLQIPVVATKHIWNKPMSYVLP